MIKSNKELIYSAIFLVAAFLWFALNPFAQIRDLTEGVYSVISVMTIGFFIFTFFCLYFSIKGMRKSGQTGINNIPWGLSLATFLLSLTLMVYIILLLTGLVKV